jgi:hypothetical protein
MHGTDTEFPILKFVLNNYHNFNARAIRDALLAYWRHIDRLQRHPPLRKLPANYGEA